jgi:hypothetical protein
MRRADAVKKIQGAGMQVLLEHAKPPCESLRACWLTSGPMRAHSNATLRCRGIQDRLNEAEVEVLERVIAQRGRNAA